MNPLQSFSQARRKPGSLLRAALLPSLLGAVISAQAVEWVGLAFPLTDVQVSASVPGLIQSISVRPGHLVKAGETLLELDSATQQAELRRRLVLLDDDSELLTARMRLRSLEDLLQMTEAVARTSLSVSREELIKARLEKTTAEGRVQQLMAQKARERVEYEQAQLEVSQRTVRAPLAGVVVDVPVDVGEWAKPGDVMMRLADISQVELRLNLPQAVAARLGVGSRVSARFEAAAAALQATGVVNFVSPLADSASGLVDVRIRFANPRGQIRPGAKAVIRGLAAPS
jgi:RND family efflux transporter MFP subunit